MPKFWTLEHSLAHAFPSGLSPGNRPCGVGGVLDLGVDIPSHLVFLATALSLCYSPAQARMAAPSAYTGITRTADVGQANSTFLS